MPEYRTSHSRYDTFLPHLAKHVSPDETIIDVGANVGDTLASMVEYNSASKYVCIEPDDDFYNYLLVNVSRIKVAVPELQVQTVKSLIGKNILIASLEGSGGTKSAVVDKQGTIKSTPLDDILLKTKKIRILKSDVDGYDYDVLDSAMDIIKSHKPLIFFECQWKFAFLYVGYCKVIDKLKSLGYCDWTIFDNFGEVIVRTQDTDILIQLMEYVQRQNAGITTRTIHYFDVLTVHASDSYSVNQALDEYI